MEAEDFLEKCPSKIVNLWYINEEERIRIMTITQGVVEVNSTAGYIWSNINGENTVKDIVSKFHNIFPEVPLKQLTDEISATIQQFVEMEIVTLDWNRYGEEKIYG